MPCPHSADGSARERARRAHVLQLLALVEHPTALPRSSALRIAQELLAWTEQDAADCRRAPLVRAAMAAETAATESVR